MITDFVIMDKEKPRISRLTALLTQLQSGRIVTATEMAEKHKVCIRTIYRDIRTLELSGVPIITEEGKGYSLLEGYKLPPVMFTEDEANALITAEQIVNQNKDQSLINNYNSAILKIKSVLKYKQKDKAELLTERIEVRANKENEYTSQHLINLQKAIVNYQVVRMDYKSLLGQQSQRDIEPFALLHTQENWILIAHCRLRKDFRSFRLDCIEKLTNTSVLFEPHKLTLQEYFEKKRKIWEAEYTPDTPLS